jgi:hypothetical protein
VRAQQATLLAQAMSLAAGERGDSIEAQAVDGFDAFGAETPPHGDEVWQSDQDLLDYARWLGRRVAALDAQIQTALRTGSPEVLAKVLPITTDWIPWEARWRTYQQQLETAWWAQAGRAIPHPWRTSEWEHVANAHKTFLEFLRRAQEAGLQTETVADPPTDKNHLTEILAETGSAVKTQALLGIGLLVAAGFFILSVKK